MDGMNSSEVQWEKLWLFEDESDSIVMDKTLSKDDLLKEQRNLLGKIILERNISKELIRSTMGKYGSLVNLLCSKRLEKILLLLHMQPMLINRGCWMIDHGLLIIIFCPPSSGW